MPKSKRDKKVSLTKTTKKGLKAKQALIEELRKQAGNYDNMFVFTTENMRNIQIKEIRGDWKDSRFFFGKNKVMKLALGKKKEDEINDNLHKVASKLKGQCGLLLTNKPSDIVIDYFEKFEERDFARSGFIATETVVLPEGPLVEFPFSMEPQLRQLGMPTTLKKGVVTLLQEYKVCKEGDKLTPEQARILKLIGNKMAPFKITLILLWTKDGTTKNLLKMKQKESQHMEE